MTYELFTQNQDKAYFLGSVLELLDSDAVINFYVPENTQSIKRKIFDGFITFTSTINGQEVGIIFNDFRSLGSSIGRDNSQRTCAFLKHLETNKIPLIYLCQSMGIRIQEGRRLFKDTFSLIPAIKSFSKNNLYLAVSLGQTLGLGAVIYSLADYRIALKDRSVFNLTGPEVFKMFLGESVDFEELCGAERMLQKNQLVHEVMDSQEDIFKKLKSIISISEELPSCDSENLKQQFKVIEDNGIKLFESFGKSVKVRIFRTEEKKIGIMFNPILRPNLISVLDMKKSRFALNLFKKLKLSLVNIVDTPGGDPRVTENDLNIAGEVYDLASDLIDYPHKKRGYIAGRCFGGASIFSMPHFFGGEPTVVLKGAKLGIMDKGIIKTLLKAGPLLKQWEEASALETDEYNDFIEDGLVESQIEIKDFIKTIKELS